MIAAGNPAGEIGKDLISDSVSPLSPVCNTRLSGVTVDYNFLADVGLILPGNVVQLDTVAVHRSDAQSQPRNTQCGGVGGNLRCSQRRNPVGPTNIKENTVLR